jgi:cytidylate kinase
MSPRSSGRLPEAVVRATEHWHARQEAAGRDPAAARGPTGFTVAVSREVGARGTTVAREVGAQLGWPVYDHELLELIARETHIRANLLQSVDERRMSWIEECMEAFSSKPMVSQSSYIRHLLQILLSLGAHGECIIVGRGAALLLPPATTLRVRLVAQEEVRVAVAAELHGLSAPAAARYIERTDRERDQFGRDHFGKDPADPSVYDLVLNSGWFGVPECADLVVRALHHRHQQAALGQHATASASR